MVSISSQYSFVADKAVQISQTVFLIKGHNPNFDTQKCKITFLIWISDLLNGWLFWVQTFGKFQYCSTFYTQATEYFCLEVLTFKMVIRVAACKPEVNEHVTFSTVNIAINDNHKL